MCGHREGGERPRICTTCRKFDEKKAYFSLKKSTQFSKPNHRDERENTEDAALHGATSVALPFVANQLPPVGLLS